MHSPLADMTDRQEHVTGEVWLELHAIGLYRPRQAAAPIGLRKKALEHLVTMIYLLPLSSYYSLALCHLISTRGLLRAGVDGRDAAWGAAGLRCAEA